MVSCLTENIFFKPVSEQVSCRSEYVVYSDNRTFFPHENLNAFNIDCISGKDKYEDLCW
jgi:hypothetical protein